MKTMKKYQTGSEVKGSKGAKASQVIAGLTGLFTGAAGIGKNISDKLKAKKAAKEKAKMEAEGKMQYGGNKKMKIPGPKTFPKPKPRPITIDEKYGILGNYGPKTESDTNMLKFINNAGKTPIPGRQKGGINKKYKTGGMVNSNTKVTALKVAGSKGVKSGVNSKVSASKVVKGRTGGTSSAPKTATPKAKIGGSMKKKSC